MGGCLQGWRSPFPSEHQAARVGPEEAGRLPTPSPESIPRTLQLAFTHSLLCCTLHRTTQRLSSPSAGLGLQALAALVWPSADLLGRNRDGLQSGDFHFQGYQHRSYRSSVAEAMVWGVATAASGKSNRSILERFLQMKYRSRRE